MHTNPLDRMAGFKGIMKLKPWLNPGHKHQSRLPRDNPDHSRGNLRRVGPENLIYLYGYLTVARWLWEVVWLLPALLLAG